MLLDVSSFCFFSCLDLVEEGGVEVEGADKQMGHGDAGYNLARHEGGGVHLDKGEEHLAELAQLLFI